MWNADFWDRTWSRKYGRYNRHHEAIWVSVIPYLKGKVVDLGCGPCVMYQGKDIDLTGVDWSATGLDEAKKNYPSGKYVRAVAHDTKLEGGQYDMVVMFGLLDYYNDWTPVINEAKRLVKPNGTILATLLRGFQGHMWTEALAKSKGDVIMFKHVCGDWYLIRIAN